MKGRKETERALEDEIQRILRGAALKMYRGIKMKTPVDTGRLRNAWTTNISPLSFSAGEKIVFSNNLPYAEVVEFGLYPGLGPKTVRHGGGIYSRQAPGGMARITVEEVAQWLENQGFKRIRI